MVMDSIGHGRILLATDLSASAAGATERALDLAAALGSDLIVFSVVDAASLRRSSGHGDRRVDQVRAEREAAARMIVERGRRRGIAASFLIWQGEAAESIVEAAGSEHADVVVVGSRGRGGVGRFVAGSVSDHVVRHAPCAVMVVRPTSNAAAASPA